MYSISTTTCEYINSSTTNCITENPYFSYGDILGCFFLFLIITLMFFNSTVNLLKK